MIKMRTSLLAMQQLLPYVMRKAIIMQQSRGGSGPVQ